MEILWKLSPQIILTILFTINSCTSLNDVILKNRANSSSHNFLIIDHLRDNEKEIRIKWKNLLGKQTSLDVRDSKRFVNSSLELTSLWQLTNGESFLQLIFSGKNLINCEYIQDADVIVNDFVEKFIDEYHYIREDKLSGTKHAKHHHYHESENIDKEVLKMKTDVKLIELKKFQDIPEDILGLMNLKKLKKQCKRLQKEIKKKFQQQIEYSGMDVDEEDLNADEENIGQRTKRQTDSWFIAPNTKWCGSGSNAQEYKELGASKADQCCRKHDICKVYIPPFQSRYEHYNFRPFTMSHCKCDRRFRTCLKMVDSNDANMVGKLFFNIVQTKCFILKSENTCILYSWWGKCLKFKAKKRAYLRDNQKY